MPLGGRDTVIVTAGDAIPAKGRPRVRFYVQHGLDAALLDADARVVYRDTETALAFIAPEVPDASLASAVVRCVKRRAFAAAREGADVYAFPIEVAADRLGAALLSGRVGSTTRDAGGGAWLELDVPPRPGALGAPVLDGACRLVGIIVAGRAGSLTAIPATAFGTAWRRYQARDER
jgi:hypothetical protein